MFVTFKVHDETLVIVILEESLFFFKFAQNVSTQLIVTAIGVDWYDVLYIYEDMTETFVMVYFFKFRVGVKLPQL